MVRKSIYRPIINILLLISQSSNPDLNDFQRKSFSCYYVYYLIYKFKVYLLLQSAFLHWRLGIWKYRWKYLPVRFLFSHHFQWSNLCLYDSFHRRVGECLKLSAFINNENFLTFKKWHELGEHRNEVG